MVDATPTLVTPRAEKLAIFKTLGLMFKLFAVAPLFFMALAFLAALPGLLRLSVYGAQAVQKPSLWTLYDVVANLLIVPVAYGAVSYVAIKATEGAGRPPLGEAVRTSLRRYFTMLGVTLLSLLAIYVGLILLLVPGAIAGCVFAVGIPVCAVEPLGPVESLRRSAALTRGSRWRILGIYIFYFLPVAVIGGASAFLLAKGGHVLASILTNAIVSLFTVPLAITLGAALYVELRRLHENVGVASVFE